jgi:hypothetical protein
VTTGHAGPFDGDAEARFNAYEEIIYARDRRILEHLSEPRRVKDLLGRKIICPAYTEGDLLQVWFEQVHLEKHLKRLVVAGRVHHDPDSGTWRRDC